MLRDHCTCLCFLSTSPLASVLRPGDVCEAGAREAASGADAVGKMKDGGQARGEKWHHLGHGKELGTLQEQSSNIHICWVFLTRPNSKHFFLFAPRGCSPWRPGSAL